MVNSLDCEESYYYFNYCYILHDVSAVLFYVKQDGRDTNGCLFSIPCKTLDANNIKRNAHVTSTYIVYVVDKTTLSSQFAYTNDHGIIYAELGQDGRLELQNINFIQCKSYTTFGGALFLNISNNGQILISNSKFIDCQSSQGGAIFVEVNDDMKLLIDNNVQFQNCQSGGSGGAIYSSINNGELNIQNSQFTSCSCNQPGNGGALAIIQESTSSVILINNSTFTDCKTTSGSSGSFGWGGSIFIQTLVTASDLTSSNFYLIDLIFTRCQSIVQSGNYIHIESINTQDTGSNITSKSLLKVNDTILTSEEQKINFMGIDKSKVIDGKEPITNHCPLFYQCSVILPSITYKDPYYIHSAQNNNDDCGTNINPYAQFHECQALSSSQTSPNGFGGAIFLTGSGDYIPSQQAIDLHGMKIYNNSAVNGASVNINNKNPKVFKFTLEGSNMIQGSLRVKIFEIIQNQEYNRQQNDISNEMIYPPEDGSTDAIIIEGDPQTDQKAYFTLNDSQSWFDPNNKQYGILTSNDGKIFTGIDGMIGQSLLLIIDVNQRSKFPWWLIMIIVLVVIIALTLFF
ncbi:MAG: hypothetical protein EZS28_002793, partial [Streblomastix strix]